MSREKVPFSRINIYDTVRRLIKKVDGLQSEFDIDTSSLVIWQEAQDASIAILDASIGVLWDWQENQDTSIAELDASVQLLFQTDFSEFITEASLGDDFVWEDGYLDVSIVTMDYDYVDGSLVVRDTRLDSLDASVERIDASLNDVVDITGIFLTEASLGNDFIWEGGYLDVSAEAIITYDTELDSSLEVPETVGGIEAGTTVSELYGSTFINMWDNLLFPTVLAYIETNNSLSLSGLSNAIAEVGTEYTPTLTATYNPGLIKNGNNTDGPNLTGDASEWTFRLPDESVDSKITATSNSQGNTYTAYNIEFGTNRWSVTCEYDEGTGEYYDNKGNIVTNLDAQRIEDSRNANSGTITGRRLAWWGYGVQDSAPTDSAGVRALSNNYFLNASNEGSFTITIPAETPEVYFYTVTGKTVVVQYIESSYADVTASFDQAAITVNDAAGVGQNYTSYISYIGSVGYPSEANYLVTIS